MKWNGRDALCALVAGLSVLTLGGGRAAALDSFEEGVAGWSSAGGTVPGCVEGAAIPGTSSETITVGKYTRNVVPTPTSLSTMMSPPLCFTTPYTVARPRPVPLPSSLVVKKGSKMRDFVSSDMPQPVSESSTRA